MLFVVIVVLIIIGLFVFQKIKKSRIEEYLQAEGFASDHLFYHDYGYLAIDTTNKKIALGRGKAKNIYNFPDVISWRRESVSVAYGRTTKQANNTITVVVRDINNPSYQINFSNVKKSNECYDVLEVALNL